MAQKIRAEVLNAGVAYPVIAANSIQFTEADAVYKTSAGFLDLVTTSSKVLGFVIESVTVAATNQTVAKDCPQVLEALEVQWQVTADQACTQTDLDAYADLVTVTTGVQVANLAAGSTGQFAVLGFDPDGDGSTTQIVCEVAEPQRFAFAQS